MQSRVVERETEGDREIKRHCGGSRAAAASRRAAACRWPSRVVYLTAKERVVRRAGERVRTLIALSRPPRDISLSGLTPWPRVRLVSTKSERERARRRRAPLDQRGQVSAALCLLLYMIISPGLLLDDRPRCRVSTRRRRCLSEKSVGRKREQTPPR